MSASRSARSRLVAVAAALAVLVTLFPTVGSAAVVEACPPNLTSTGFRDLSGLNSETVAAINCVAHYGIAQGVSATRFDPAGEVSRWQMALFLIRMADDLGIVVPTATGSLFDDISSYPAATQQAINQLAQLGITTGVAARRFDPAASVPRWQMALFLTRLHAKAGFILPSAGPQGFTDIVSYPAATQLAINQLAALGVAKGTSTNTFSPEARVLRWQMALFLARELQAGGAAPYRITITAEPTSSPTNGQVIVTVTVLSPTGAPVVGRLVDVFVGGLDSSGRCVLDTDTTIGSGNAGTSTDCRIDSNDPKTDSTGKVKLTLRHNTVIETTRVHAWIGATDQTFDSDVVSLYKFVDINWTAAPAAIVMPSKSVRFGTNTTVTGWLADAQGNPVPASGMKIVVTVSRGGSQIIAQTLQTGADGRFSFSYTGPSDPNPNADNPAVVDTVKAFWDKDGDGVDDGAAEFDVTSTVTWDDATPRADLAVLSQSSVSTLVGQAITVTAVVTDKFGSGISSAVVEFTVSGVNGFTTQVVTNSSGVASLNYTGVNAGVDVIDATVDVDGGGVDIPASQVADLTHYTVVAAGDIAGETTFTVVAVNTSANTIDVIGGGGFFRLSYDSSNDTFTVNGTAGSMGAFESALSGLSLPATNKLKTNPYSATTSGASSFILTTS